MIVVSWNAARTSLFPYQLTVNLQLVQTNAGLLFDNVKNGSRLVADSLEGGPSDVRRSTILRESNDHSTGIGVPVSMLFAAVSLSSWRHAKYMTHGASSPLNAVTK
jgi:hypothetical protein